MSTKKILIPLLGITKHGGSTVIYDIIWSLHEYFNITVLTLSYDDKTIIFPTSVKIINLNFKKRNFLNIIIFYFYLLFFRFRFKYIFVSHFIIALPFIFSFKFKFILFIQGEEFNVLKNFLIKYLLRILYILSIKNSHAISTSSLLGSKYKIPFINLGIDDKFIEKNHISNQKKFDIIYFARTEPYKRFNLFYDIYKDTSYNCLIVTNKNELINSLQSNNFTYKYISNISELIECIDLSHLTLLTSDYEGLALTPLECMARGVVPIIRDCWGPHAYGINGLNCIIISNDAKKDEYLNNTKDILNNYPALTLLSEQAKLTAKKFKRSSFLIEIKNEIINYYNF
jgi:hypothetical protein